MGALLAMCSVSGFGLLGAREFLLRLGLIIGLPVLILFFYLHSRDIAGHLRDRTHYTATALAGAWLIGRAADRFEGIFGRFLSSGPMVYTGRISYGLYVWHPFVSTFIVWSLAQVGERPRWNWGLFLLAFAGSFIVASASWFAFERPMNALKRYFEYDPRAREAASGGNPRCNFLASGG
jgi:peptidoglycan/LPS O-acetylase OafA/YrhL